MATSKILKTLLIVTVIAVFGAGCSSDNPTRPGVIDTAPPAVPVNVTAEYSANQAVISWAPNTVDADLAGYLVNRTNEGVTDTLLATPTMITSFNDDTPKSGKSVYHVIAVDEAGNQSAIASVFLNIGSEVTDLNLTR